MYQVFVNGDPPESMLFNRFDTFKGAYHFALNEMNKIGYKINQGISLGSNILKDYRYFSMEVSQDNPGVIIYVRSQFGRDILMKVEIIAPLPIYFFHPRMYMMIGMVTSFYGNEWDDIVGGRLDVQIPEAPEEYGIDTPEYIMLHNPIKVSFPVMGEMLHTYHYNVNMNLDGEYPKVEIEGVLLDFTSTTQQKSEDQTPSEECIPFVKDRWQVVLDALRIYYQKSINHIQTEIENAQARTPPGEQQTNHIFDMLMRTLNYSLSHNRSVLREIDSIQLKVDNEDTNLLYNNHEWNYWHKKMIDVLDDMKV